MKKIILVIISVFLAISASATEPKDLIIYINPGHGGHDSDDRNVQIDPYAAGDPEGFWESNSNLDKGLMLRDLLEAKGCKVVMSRVTNTSDDDLGLTTIGGLANKSNADMFFSIHSNATGTSSRINYTLMLFRGYTDQPQIPESKVMATVLGSHMITNEATVWTVKNPYIYGDWSFYTSWGTQGLGVLRALTVPGMLSEGSFHDYIPETYRLMNMDFKWLEAWHFLKGINEYFGLSGQSTGHVVGCIYDSRVERNEGYIMYEKDRQAPLNEAKVQLLDANGNLKEEYTTDNLQNGFYAFKNLEPGDYKIKVIKDTHYTQEVSVSITADDVTYANIPMNKVRNTPPEVLSYSPEWKEGDAALLCNSKIIFNFNWDMDVESTEKAFSIEPAVKGTFSWEDANYRMIFTPDEPYATNTSYTVTLDKSAMHGGGTGMVQPFSFAFKTDNRNYMGILGSSPSNNGEVHYKSAIVQVQTDNTINATPIYDQVTVKDSQNNVMEYNKRGASFNKSADGYGWVKLPLMSALTVGEQYTLILSGKLADKDGITIDGDKEIKFTAIDAGAAKDNLELIAPFDDATLFEVNTEGSAGYSGASIAKDTSGKLFDAACNTFKHKFTNDNDGVVLYSLKSPGQVAVTSENSIGIHVNGDMCGNDLYAVFASGSDTKEIKICPLDFMGWKYIKVGLSGLDAGKDYNFTGIKIVQTNALMGKNCSIKLDNLLKLEGGSGVGEIEIKSLSVYPNPASEYLIVNADTLIEGLQLVSTSGATVAETSGNIMNVSEIPSGNYILKIKVAGQYTHRMVIVAH